MNWKKINIESIMEVLRAIEKETMTLDAEPSVTYSDGKEEIKIIYKRLEDSSKP